MKKIITLTFVLFLLAGCGKVDKGFLEGTWKSETSDERMIFYKNTVESFDRDGENPEEYEYRVTDTADDTFLVDLNLDDNMMITEEYTRVDKNKIELDRVTLYDSDGDTMGDARGGKTFVRESGGGFFNKIWDGIKIITALAFVVFGIYAVYRTFTEKK